MNKLIFLVCGLFFLIISPFIPENQPDPEFVEAREYVMATQQLLASNLVGAIEEKGTAGAVTFCNTRAIAITDSMIAELGVFLKRVSDKPRNPDNMLNQKELEYLIKAKRQLTIEGQARPEFTKSESGYVAYFPIITNGLCMQCHGRQGIEVTGSTLDKINELYPNDKATGYGLNQIRGVWVVEKKR